MQDLLDNALDVAVALGRVERAERGGALTVGDVGREDGPAPLTLPADDAAHGVWEWLSGFEKAGRKREKRENV